MKKVVLLAAMLVGLGSTAAYAQFKYVEGVDYQPIAEVIDEAKAPKVIEFFWYGCPHCEAIHEPLQQWVKDGKSEAVVLETVPAMPSARWEIGGHLFYTAKALGLNINDKVFDEVHHQHNAGIIFDPSKAKAFLVSQGASKEDVEKAWDSFAVKQDIQRAKKLFEDSGLNGVPAFVVNGMYEVPVKGDYATFFPRLNSIVQSSQTQSAK